MVDLEFVNLHSARVLAIPTENNDQTVQPRRGEQMKEIFSILMPASSMPATSVPKVQSKPQTKGARRHCPWESK